MWHIQLWVYQFCAKKNKLSCLYLLIVACIALTHSSAINAQQTHFSAARGGVNTNFDYKWRTQEGEYTLSFTLDSRSLYAMPPSPPNYSPQVFQSHVYVQVMQAAKLIDPKLAKIEVKKNNSGLSFNVSSRHGGEQAQQVLDKLKSVHDKAQDDYWTDNYFVKYKAPNGASGIRHDHAKYTANSSEALLPLVDAIKQLQNNPSDAREFIQIALSWIQSIPYNRLEDRLSSNGAGFISPRDLLLQNQGDCDSKSTLMASLLTAYSPRADIQMVYLPEHALLAVDLHSLNLRENANELTLSSNEANYVLLEPTGPAQLHMGEVAPSTKLSLRNRQFNLASMSL